VLSAQLDAAYPLVLRERMERGQLAHILLIGSDARPGEEQTRSDTIILLSIDTVSSQVALVSIPRDTRIHFQGKDSKINMVNQIKGPAALCSEVGKLLNIAVDHYVVTDFSGFEEIIDLFGGVWMDVDISVYSYRQGVVLEKGWQHLSGKEALAYARFRANPDMDIGRVQRQQRLLTALARQMLEADNIARIPQLIPSFKEHVKTNLTLGDMFYLAQQFRQLKEGNIITQTLPGYHYFAPYSGASYWEVDRNTARVLLPGLFAGQRFETYCPAPPGVNQG
jgi:LCP family protein required for cell wall assembly